MYYDTYHMFMNSKNPSPLPTTVQACDLHSSDFTEDPREVSELGWMRFYPRPKDPAIVGNYYYVIKLPMDFRPANVEIE